MLEIKDLLGKSPQEFLRECLKMSEIIKKKKEIWKRWLDLMSDDEFQQKVCSGSEPFICYKFYNEKYFLGISDEKPIIKVNDDISFSMECPKWQKGFCHIKKKSEEKIKICEEEDL